MRTFFALLAFSLVVPAASADGPSSRAAFPDAPTSRGARCPFKGCFGEPGDFNPFRENG